MSDRDEPVLLASATPRGRAWFRALVALGTIVGAVTTGGIVGFGAKPYWLGYAAAAMTVGAGAVTLALTHRRPNRVIVGIVYAAGLAATAFVLFWATVIALVLILLQHSQWTF